MINLKAIKIFCGKTQCCKLKQVIKNSKLKGCFNKVQDCTLTNDTVEIKYNALRKELLRIRDNYIAKNPEAFLTLDHIKSNFDNWIVIKSVKGQTSDLNAVSTEDFCNLSEIMKGIRLPREVNVYRAMEAKDFNIGKLSPEEFFKHYFSEGKEVIVPIYMSTSFDKQIAYRFAKNNPYRFIINLKVPKNHPAVYMENLAPGDIGAYGCEDELLIIKNSRVIFEKLKGKKNPLSGEPTYEIDAAITGFNDIHPSTPKGFTMDEEMQELLKALMDVTCREV